jgi:hypothetical protein
MIDAWTIPDQVYDNCLPFRFRIISQIIKIAPQVMAESATLKAGQWAAPT